MFELMVFMILFFVGITSVMGYLIIKIDNNYKQLSEEHAGLRVMLRAIESQIEQLTSASPSAAGGVSREKSYDIPSQAAYDPLLRLSFEEAPKPEEDFSKHNLELNLDLEPKKNS